MGATFKLYAGFDGWHVLYLHLTPLVCNAWSEYPLLIYLRTSISRFRALLKPLLHKTALQPTYLQYVKYHYIKLNFFVKV